jgi:hypothetical protein
LDSNLYVVDAEGEVIYVTDMEAVEQRSLFDLHPSAELPTAATAALRSLDPRRKGNLIKLLGPNDFIYEGPTKGGEGNSIQGNWVVTPGTLAYYEVHLLSGGKAPEVGVGFACEDYNLDEDFPGWKPHSWALHCDNGVCTILFNHIAPNT